MLSTNFMPGLSWAQSGLSWGHSHTLPVVLAPCLCAQPSHSLWKPFLSPCLRLHQDSASPLLPTLVSLPQVSGNTAGWLGNWSCFVLFFSIVLHEVNHRALSLKCSTVNHYRENKQNRRGGEDVRDAGSPWWLLLASGSWILLNDDSKASQGEWLEPLELCLGSHRQPLKA